MDKPGTQSQALQHFGLFILRSPLLPANRWLTDEQEDRWRFLSGVVSEPDVQEALFLASESLAGEIAGKPPADWPDKIRISVAKYFARMCTRSTPFGLFATVSAGKIGAQQSAFHLAPRAQVRRRTRIDMLALDTCCVQFNADERVRNGLSYAVNDTAWRFGRSLHYVEIFRATSLSPQLRLAFADIDEYLDFVLHCASTQSTLESLSSRLHQKYAAQGVEIGDARDYVNKLVDAQILRSSLWPKVTGLDSAQDIVQQLVGIEQHELAAGLNAVLDDLAWTDAHVCGVEPDRYVALAKQLSAKIHPNKLVQVDAFRPAVANLSEADVSMIAGALTLLSGITLRPPADEFASFCKRFEERYGDREVPLLEALDEDSGLGFESPESSGSDHTPILVGIPLAGARPSVSIEPTKLGVLLKLLDSAMRTGAIQSELTQSDIDLLSDESPAPVSTTLVAIVSIERRPGEEDTILIRTAGSTSGANMISRFCGMDPVIDHLVDQVCRADERAFPDAIVAEVVHLAGGREGNVVTRPVLRSYEIEYLGRSGAAEDYRVPARDLVLSVRRRRPVLRSLRLNREVVPKLTSAHNVMRGIPIYRFLRSLDASRSKTGLGWSWGPLTSAPFLPRITWRRVVLSRAQWSCNSETFGSGHARSNQEVITQWRHDARVPRWVALVEGDHELALDLEQEADRAILVRAAKNSAALTVAELFPKPEHYLGGSDEGRHACEFLIPFRSSTTPVRQVPTTRSGPSRRRFGAASVWRYAKLYAGTSQIDRLLLDEVSTLTAELTGAGIIDKWFYVRFFDPESHLRIRFRSKTNIAPPVLAARVDRWLEQLLASGAIWRAQIDSYDREVERYGGPDRIDAAEDFFHIDSVYTQLLLRELELHIASDRRWLAALVSVHRLLDAFGLDVIERRALMEMASAASVKEVGAGKATRIGLGNRFRAERTQILQALRYEPAGNEFTLHLRTILDTRTGALAAVADRLIASSGSTQLASRDRDVVLSVVHMHVNRLLRSSHQQQEMVLYDWLSRIYGAWRHLAID